MIVRHMFAALAASLLAFALAGSVLAQPALPAGMSQQEFDSLVSAISKSVLENLKAERPAAPPAPAPAAAAKRGPFDAAGPNDGPDELTLFLRQAVGVVKAVPALGGYFGEFHRVLDERAAGGLGRGMFLLLLLVVVGAALSAEALIGVATRGMRARFATDSAPQRGLRSLYSLVLLLLMEGAGVLAFWIVGRAATALWFGGSSIQDRFAVAILLALLFWRVYALAFRAVLRPGLAAARLCDMEDDDARRLYRLMSAFVLFAILLRITYYVVAAMQATPEAIEAGRLIVAPFLLAALIFIVVRTRAGARQWFVGLGRVAPVVGFIGRHWTTLAVAFFITVIATQVYGAISGRTGVPSAMILTLNVMLGLLFCETLMQAMVRRLDSQLDGFTPAADRPKLPDVVARCVRVAVLIGIVIVLGESWVVGVLRLVNESAWERLTSAGRAAGITLFVAFVVWELFGYALESYVTRAAQRNAEGGAAPGAVATRFDTLMPVLRVTVAVILSIIALLVALDQLGVNIGPLLAGASVLGLAISFGSQTLVRDIVSGVFYLADDAFRVGEYIDCGRAKGTVEGFTLRSVRLRHQNGQIHTIPFGSLGQITNFSRDWTAVKFTLPFALNTDLEKLRKAAKKIGTDLMEEPEFSKELIDPFKMQGIADITDSAMIVRFKFTARPGNPSAIQNQAVTRLLQALPEQGIALSGAAAQ